MKICKTLAQKTKISAQ